MEKRSTEGSFAMEHASIFDLHCDTLTPCITSERCEDTLNDPTAQICLSQMPAHCSWAQCFAVFIPDKLTRNGAGDFYRRYRDSFHRQMAKFSRLVSPCRTAAQIEQAWSEGKTAALLTVENGSALEGNLEQVDFLVKDGVVMMTLTWNGINEIGSGNVSQQGLTPFGKAVIRRMEEAGILVDVSHLNDPGFHDLLKIAKKPFVASHSNARAVCAHSRNLTDDQIREMAARRCLIGLNYYDGFLREGGGARPEDLRRHVEHFLELGAEHCLALGSDFDGADIPDWLDSPGKAADLRERLLSWGLPEELCDKILYRNALDFFRANLG